MTLISSRSNPKIKSVRALRRKKTRQESGQFMAEGIRHVGEAFEAKAEINSAYYAPDLLRGRFADDLIVKLQSSGIPVYETTVDVFSSMSEKDNPQGILAIVNQANESLSKLNPGNFPWGVALASPQDPGNIGTILRTIDAVGASGLILLENSADPYHPSAVRASMGTLFWHPIVQADFHTFKSWVENQGYTVYGTSASGDIGVQEINQYVRPCILLMGSEREGLSSDQSQICSKTIRLPMLGRATSLNLAVATGVMLYNMLES